MSPENSELVWSLNDLNTEKNSTKVYAAANNDTGKTMHASCFRFAGETKNIIKYMYPLLSLFGYCFQVIWDI